MIRIVSLVLGLALLTACGGGGSSGDAGSPESPLGPEAPSGPSVPGTGGGGDAQAALTGGLVWLHLGELCHVALPKGRPVCVSDWSKIGSMTRLGYDRVATFFASDEPTGGAMREQVVDALRWDGQAFVKQPELFFNLQVNEATGRFTSAIQASPQGAYLTYSTLESPQAFGAETSYVNVARTQTREVQRFTGDSGHVVWLDADRFIISASDGLYLLTPTWDGSQAVSTRIAEDLGAVDDFDVSPDGLSIAYTKDKAIWRMAIDGGSRVQLTEPYANNLGPLAWSPDGQRILVALQSCYGMDGGARPRIIRATTLGQKLDDALIPENDSGRFSVCGRVYWMAS